MKVFTTRGLIEFNDLCVQDVVELGDNHRKVISQYYLGDDLVRQSVFIDVLRPLEADAAEGKVGG